MIMTYHNLVRILYNISTKKLLFLGKHCILFMKSILLYDIGIKIQIINMKLFNTFIFQNEQ